MLLILQINTVLASDLYAPTLIRRTQGFYTTVNKALH